MRDRGIDLIAYLDAEAAPLAAFPIQLKAATEATFSLDVKYERIANLVLAYMWHVGNPSRTVTFALTYGEALAVLEQMGHTKTESWTNQGRWVVTQPSERVRDLLEPYRMIPESWPRKFRALAGPRSAAA